MAKILLVEDDNNLREIYEARLQAEGYDVVAASDGEEALVVAKNEEPDLVISDVMMPKISGFEMLDIMRNTEKLRDVKVIMLTALGQAEDQSRANKLGADRYLVKSQVTLEDIVNVAKDLLVKAGAIAAPEPVAPPAPAPVPAAAPTEAAAISVAAAPPVAVPVAPAPPAAPQPAPAVAPVVPAAPVPAAAPAPAPAEPISVAAPPAEPATVPAIVPTTPVAAPAEPVGTEPATTVPAVAAPEPIAPAAEPVAATPSASVAQPAPAPASEPAASQPTAEPSVAGTAEPLSSAQEEQAIEAQIEDFVDSQPATAPAEVVPSNPLAASEAIEPEVTAPETPPPADATPAAGETTTSEQEQALTNAMGVLDTDKAPAEPVAPPVAETPSEATEPASAEPDGAVAHKKIIHPISDSEQPKKSIEQLLAEEEGRQIMRSGSTSGQPAADVQPTPQILSQPTATPEVKVTPPPANPTDFDPNSIAL